MSKRRAIGGITITLALVVGGWLALSAKKGDTSEQAAPYQPEAWQMRLVHRGAAELRRDRAQVAPLTAFHGRAEGMPVGMRRRVAKNLPGSGPLHLRFDGAQYVRTDRDLALWITEGRGVTCIFRDKIASSACRTSAGARREGIWLGTYKTSRAHPGRPSHFLAFGVVPNGVRAVAVEVDGSSPPTIVQTKNDVWAVRAETPIHIKHLVR
jgi:hypothetical protein